MVIIEVSGPQGCGKSTVAKALFGALQHAHGPDGKLLLTVELHEKTSLYYPKVSQDCDFVIFDGPTMGDRLKLTVAFR